MARSALAWCRVGWYSVRAVMCQCVFGSFCILIYHHGKFIIMVNCVCGDCTNSSLSGHRAHRFPNKENNCYIEVLEVLYSGPGSVLCR